MTAHTLPRLAHHTIALDAAGHMHGTIGLCGRLLLDSGRPTYEVVSLMQTARKAAATSNIAALAVLESAGFRFV
jgi:hypothetical protein